MPWIETPLTTIRNRVKQDFLSRLNEVDDAPLRRSVENVWVYVLAGASYGMNQFINWGARQFIPSEDSDVDSLLRWANNLLTVPRNPALPAYGDILVTASAPATMPAGWEWTNRDGITFSTDAEHVFAGPGSAAVSVTAVEAGAAGNTESSATLFIGEGIVGIEDQAMVGSAGLGAGADQETKFGVLNRLRERFQNPPRGGSAGDYIAWAKEITSVTRAFEFPQTPTTGWVTLVVVDDNNGVSPTSQTVADAQARVDLRRPIMMGGATVRAPAPQNLGMIWSGLVPNDTPTRTALEASVNAWVLANGAPGEPMRQPDIENAAQAVVTSVSLAFPITDPDPGEFGMFTTFTHNYV